jgi:hypothetical protein
MSFLVILVLFFSSTINVFALDKTTKGKGNVTVVEKTD